MPMSNQKKLWARHKFVQTSEQTDERTDRVIAIYPTEPRSRGYNYLNGPSGVHLFLKTKSFQIN